MKIKQIVSNIVLLLLAAFTTVNIVILCTDDCNDKQKEKEEIGNQIQEKEKIYSEYINEIETLSDKVLAESLETDELKKEVVYLQEKVSIQNKENIDKKTYYSRLLYDAFLEGNNQNSFLRFKELPEFYYDFSDAERESVESNTASTVLGALIGEIGTTVLMEKNKQEDKNRISALIDFNLKMQKYIDKHAGVLNDILEIQNRIGFYSQLADEEVSAENVRKLSTGLAGRIEGDSITVNDEIDLTALKNIYLAAELVYTAYENILTENEAAISEINRWKLYMNDCNELNEGYYSTPEGILALKDTMSENEGELYKYYTELIAAYCQGLGGPKGIHKSSLTMFLRGKGNYAFNIYSREEGENTRIFFISQFDNHGNLMAEFYYDKNGKLLCAKDKRTQQSYYYYNNSAIDGTIDLDGERVYTAEQVQIAADKLQELCGDAKVFGKEYPKWGVFFY